MYIPVFGYTRYLNSKGGRDYFIDRNLYSRQPMSNVSNLMEEDVSRECIDADVITPDLPEDLKEIALTELGETQEIREAATRAMRVALDHKHLSNRWLEDIPYIVMYLRHGKVSPPLMRQSHWLFLTQAYALTAV